MLGYLISKGLFIFMHLINKLSYIYNLLVQCNANNMQSRPHVNILKISTIGIRLLFFTNL
jgi:hypothetical protein